jgi:hypothetical protein
MNHAQWGLLPRNNPFLLTPAQSIFFLFQTFENDGDLLAEWLPIICKRDSFSRTEAGEDLITAFRNIHSGLKTGQKQARLSRYRSIRELKSLLETFDKKPQRESGGGKETVRHRVSPRLESLVDIGLLCKQTPEVDRRFDFHYFTTKNLVALSESLQDCDSVSDYLERHFFSHAMTILPEGAKPVDDQESIFSYFAKAYSRLRRPVGDNPIRPLALRAALLSLADAPPKVFEISDAYSALRTCQKSYPRQVHLSGVRISFRPEFVHISEELLSKYASPARPGDRENGRIPALTQRL